MATYSVNQVTQVYVPTAYKAGEVLESDPIGTIGVTAVTTNTANPYFYFSYVGAGGLLRSDLIHLK
jgi:hypothetical protein